MSGEPRIFRLQRQVAQQEPWQLVWKEMFTRSPDGVLTPVARFTEPSVAQMVLEMRGEFVKLVNMAVLKDRRIKDLEGILATRNEADREMLDGKVKTSRQVGA